MQIPGSEPAKEAEASTFPRYRRGLTVGGILALLMASIIVPALIFAVVLLQRNNQAQEGMVTALAEATAASITQTLERNFTGLTTNLRVFATARSLETGALQQFHERAVKALDGTGSHLIALDESYGEVLNTLTPFASALGSTSEADAARRAGNPLGPTVTGVFRDEATQKWAFDVVLPLEGTVGPVRHLILSQSVDVLNSAISSQNLRGGWNAVIVDAEGTVAASSFMSSDVGKPFFLSNDVLPISTTRHSTVDVDGRTYETVRSYSETSGWETIVWAQSSVVRAPMARTMRSLALGGIAIIAVGAMLAWLIGRQITLPIRALARDARRLGKGESVTAVDYRVAEIATVSQALAHASRSRQDAENEIRFLMREVAHRSKNQLTVVSSIAKQTARHARTFAAFQDAFQKRVHGLARSTDLLIAGGVAGVELRELVEAQIGPFRPAGEKRVSVEGAPFRLSNQAAQTLGLALHELATNAAKYGAFAANEGRLYVSWERAGTTLEFTWREQVPRLRKRAETRGFGTEVIERMLGGTLDAKIDRVLRSDGLECRVTMPLSKLEPELIDDQEAL